MVIPLTPVRFFEYAERIFAEKEGVVCEGERFTYGEFCKRVRRMSNALIGIGSGERGDGWLIWDTTATVFWSFFMPRFCTAPFWSR